MTSMRAMAALRASLVGLALVLAWPDVGAGQDVSDTPRTSAGSAAASAAEPAPRRPRPRGDRRSGRAGGRGRSSATRRSSRATARAGHTTRTRSRATGRARRTARSVVEPGVGSLSVGRPNRGRLIRGVALEESEHIAVKTSSRGQRYGTAELVSLLDRVARRVAERSPGARLHVGDLSRETGGRFGPHRSHRSGRDADVGLYLLDAEGAPILTERFYDIRRDGSARQDPSVRLDEGRTWELVEALVTDEETPVQFIFLAAHVEQRLLAEGRRRGASEELLARVDAVIDAERQHTNHMHVRIYCPTDDIPRCDEEPPYHPWVDRSAAREAAAVARARDAERRREAARAARRRRARTTRTAGTARGPGSGSAVAGAP